MTAPTSVINVDDGLGPPVTVGPLPGDWAGDSGPDLPWKPTGRVTDGSGEGSGNPPSESAGQGRQWVWVPNVGPYGWVSRKVAPAGVDEPKDPGKFGQIFQDLGYKYLGPGTDLDYNISHHVMPVDALDAAAKLHDQQYKQIADMYERGSMDYGQALAAIRSADLTLSDRFYRDQSILGILASLGMGSKAAFDWFMGQPSFIELKRPPSVPPESRGPDYSDIPSLPGGGQYEPPDYSYMHDVLPPMSSISVGRVIDRNNNGIPDVLEKRSKKRIKRFQPYRRQYSRRRS